MAARIALVVTLAAAPAWAHEGAENMPPRLRPTWVAATTTGLLGLGATVVSVSAWSRFRDLETSCAPLCDERDVSDLRTRARVADVFWALTAVGAAATLGLRLWESGRVGVARVEAAPGSVRARW